MALYWHDCIVSSIKKLSFPQVAQLETESQKIAGIYDSARLEAHRAIEAAGVYGEVVQALRKGREEAKKAKKMAGDAQNELKGAKEAANSTRQRGQALWRSMKVGNETIYNCKVWHLIPR